MTWNQTKTSTNPIGGVPAMSKPRLTPHPPGQNRIGPRTPTMVKPKAGSRVGTKPKFSVPHTTKL